MLQYLVKVETQKKSIVPKFNFWWCHVQTKNKLSKDHPTDHVNVIKLLKWEIIWTGGLPHLPGVPHHHVNRPFGLMNGVLLENFLTTFNYWFTWEEVVGLTSKGKSCLLAVSRMSNHGSFERSLGAGKAVETGSRSIAEESI